MLGPIFLSDPDYCSNVWGVFCLLIFESFLLMNDYFAVFQIIDGRVQ